MAAPSNKKQTVEFVYGPMWEESLANAIKDTPNILQKVKEFRDVKQGSPLASFGTSDNTFISGGIYKSYLPKARKAHLTQDYSIIYELSGRDPTLIKLYGVFNHADLGTGQPPNIKLQKNMAKRLSREDIETYLKKLLID